MAAEFVATKLAEAIVSQVVQRLAELLIQADSSLRGIREDVRSLKTELDYMQCFLKDADRKQGEDELVRKWITDVKDIAGEIVDSIETYIYKVHNSYITMFHLFEIRGQINSIKAKIQSIGDRRQRYQIELIKGDGTKSLRLRNWRRTYPDDEEHDVITLKEPAADLKKKLKEKEGQRRIVSIVGMGGLGKTTLAKRIYNDAEVKKCFNCHAWVYISQQYVQREVLTEILLQVGFEKSNQLEGREFIREKNMKETLEERITNREFLKRLEEHELVNLMKNELQNKQYLIVLDDIWDIKAWNGVKNALPNGRSGSKILFTTRIEAVASSADCHDSSIIRLPFLTSDESLELLKRIVFPRESFMECGYPSEFEKLGNEMLKKCGGLPLAIVVLGGLLRKNNSKEGWAKVLEDVKKSQFMINKLESNQEYRVEDILDLSFQDLPYYLKACFLYMGIFPEDSEISKSMLVRLWIAEGFVSRQERKVANESMEDIAEQCLEELIDRCMVQVDKKNLLGTRVKTCRLHDLMRDFCISKAKKENVFDIIDEDQMKTSRSLSIEYQVTHLSRRIVVPVNRGLDVFPLTEQVPPRISSFMLFGIDTFSTLSSRVKNFRLLKVLSLDFLEKSSIPNKSLRGIGTLLLLRYLRLSIPSGKMLIIPNCIGNLQNLQTLDIQGVLARIPQSLARLIHLRHLLLPYYRYNTDCTCRMIRSPLFGMFSLTNIETLKGIEPEDLIVNGKVISLVNIRKLNTFYSSEEEKVRMVVESLSHCHYLTSLTLAGNFSTTNFSFLPNSLLKLKLDKSQLNEAIFTDLQKLPNLRLLKLSFDGVADDIDSYKFVCSIDGFPKLEILVLSELFGLKEWEVEENAMPNLKRLDIECLKSLKMIPEGLKNVTTLRELNIKRMSEEFEKRLRRVNKEDGSEGEDYYKVSHVPTITFSDIY